MVVFFLMTLLLLLFIRLFYLQVLSFQKFSSMADEQHNAVIKIEPRRGTIFDRFMEPLAINLDVPSVYCDPRGIRDKERTADLLSGALGVDREMLSERLSKDKSFIWAKRKIAGASADKIKELRLPGVYIMTESKRSYPNDNMAAHVIGFAGVDNEGLEGLESLFNEELVGKPGWKYLLRDARQEIVLLNERESMPAQNGYNLVLTVDSVIQYIAEEELRAMAKKFKVREASVIVMDPFTGEILAMANYPDYDLNSFGQAPREVIKNIAVASVFEPGSVFKIVTASAALNEGKVTLEDTFYCENGDYRAGGRVLHDFHRYGDLSFREVVSKSSNIGTVKVAERLGEKKLYEYIHRFGFGQNTGVELPGEVGGISRPSSKWSRSDITTIPIGQGIAVTPIQLACAVSVIANGGYLMRPYIIKEVTTWEGEAFKKYEPAVRRRVISEETCGKMKEALVSVITEGTGRYAASKLYDVCGKTGTAQMVNPNGGYYSNKYDATFIGFAPVEFPAVSIVVTARDPRTSHFGGTVAGPTFRNIAERVLQYLGEEKSGAEDNA